MNLSLHICQMGFAYFSTFPQALMEPSGPEAPWREGKLCTLEGGMTPALQETSNNIQSPCRRQTRTLSPEMSPTPPQNLWI